MVSSSTFMLLSLRSPYLLVYPSCPGSVPDQNPEATSVSVPMVAR